MSTSRNLKTPHDEHTGHSLPQKIYVRRRIAAGVVLVLAIVLVWFLVKSLTGGEQKQESNAQHAVHSKSMDATSPVEPPNKKDKSEEPSASKSSAAKKSDSEQSDKPDRSDESSAASAKDVCTVSDLQVTASPSQPTFDANTQPSFYVNIKNPTKGDCEVDFEANPLMFEIFTLNNYQRVWGSLDCNKPEVTGTVDIKAGEEVNYQLSSWSRTTSAKDQCQNRQPVGAGSFLLYGHVGDNVSEPATFNLS